VALGFEPELDEPLELVAAGFEPELVAAGAGTAGFEPELELELLLDGWLGGLLILMVGALLAGAVAGPAGRLPIAKNHTSAAMIRIPRMTPRMTPRPAPEPLSPGPVELIWTSDIESLLGDV
jgi:hypothetical protein